MFIRLFNVKIFLKYFFLFFLFCLQGIQGFADINLQGQTPNPEFFNKRHHFGDIYQGQIVSHQFQFKNTGNGVLILTSLHASCGCVNPKTFAEDGTTIKNIFKPGEEGMVAVDFDSSQFAGPIVRTVTVETNDNNSQTITLTLTANIKQEITTKPAMLYLGKIQKNDEKNFDIQLKLKKNNIKILSVESDLPFIQATIHPVLNNENTLNISVQIQKTDTLPIGPFQGNLTVANTSKYYKSLKIPIMGEVVGHVQTSTKYLEFGVVNKSGFAERTISFQSKNKDFDINAITIELNNFVNFDIRKSNIFDVEKTQIAFLRDGDLMNEYAVKIKLKYPSGNIQKLNPVLLTGLNISGNFLIETTDLDYAQIKVPFFGILKQE